MIGLILLGGAATCVSIRRTKKCLLEKLEHIDACLDRTDVQLDRIEARIDQIETTLDSQAVAHQPTIRGFERVDQAVWRWRTWRARADLGGKS